MTHVALQAPVVSQVSQQMQQMAIQPMVIAQQQTKPLVGAPRDLQRADTPPHSN